MAKLLRRYRVIALLGIIVTYVVVCVFTGGEPLTVNVSAVPNDDGCVDYPTVVIDAGHGGADGGCVSIDGVPEKGINLTIALEVGDILSSMGYDVVYTRDSDVSLHDRDIKGLSNQKKSDMQKRLDIINSYDNAVAVSIHQNQFTQNQYSGAQMFCTQSNPNSLEFAELMQRNFVSLIQPNNNREVKVVGDELFLIYFAQCPSVMIECGFLSNPDESRMLQDSKYQKQVAFTIATGIMQYVSQK